MSCSEEGKPLSKKALKKLQKEKEKAERKAATAAKLAEEKAARDAANVVCLLYFNESIMPLYLKKETRYRTFRKTVMASFL